jgi:hypothetical protein
MNSYAAGVFLALLYLGKEKQKKILLIDNKKKPFYFVVFLLTCNFAIGEY